MTDIIQPMITVNIENAQPSGPAGSTSLVQPLNPPPDPPASFAALPRGLNSGLEAAQFQAVAYGQESFVAVANGGYAARSTDGGVTWTALTQGLNSGLVGANFRGVTGGTDGVFVAVAFSGHAARSTDDGATWTALPQFLNAGGLGQFNDVTNNNGTFVVVGNSSECARSTDNGATWVAATAVTGGGSLQIGGINRLAAADQFIMTAPNGIVGISTNDGASFGSFLTPQGLNAGATSASFNSAAQVGDNIVVAGRAQYNAISTNGGTTWAALPLYLNSGQGGTAVFNRMALDRSGNIMAVQENGRSALSTDGGENWTAQPQGLNSGLVTSEFKGVATDDNGTWIIVGEEGYCSRGTP